MFLYFLLALILVLITFVFGLIIVLIGNLNCEKIEMFPELLKNLGLKTTFQTSWFFSLQEQEGATLLVSAKFTIVSVRNIYLQFEEVVSLPSMKHVL